MNKGPFINDVTKIESKTEPPLVCYRGNFTNTLINIITKVHYLPQFEDSIMNASYT